MYSACAAKQSGVADAQFDGLLLRHQMRPRQLPLEEVLHGLLFDFQLESPFMYEVSYAGSAWERWMSCHLRLCSHIAAAR